ncbi:hypothetical protein DYBT9275_02820 [Dyadobacter sp. CECT 9275]|uniref:Tetratricopeptide repeat protein n=1 Tax=Dyadobacter helix TaxID=2822344 RepID=A0A916JBJ1_9BACT|nr:hypothetical protein [Dyadobacter sp. CECT 9275]CAG5002147.1 hypothetical protein DYBT9275_02820 [Dyadobacter sp. CECT 9275]
MALTDEQIERIEGRANGTLSEEETALLEQELGLNPALQQEAAAYLDVYWALKSMALMPHLKGIHARLKEEEMEAVQAETVRPLIPDQPGNVFSLTRINWGWAAAAAVVLFVFGVGIVNYRHKQNDRLYGMYEQTLEKSFVMSRPEYPAFQEKSGELKAYEKFRSGVDLMKKGQPEKAVPLLEAALRSQNKKVRQEGEWFLSLAYLKMNERRRARKLIDQIASEPDSKFNKQALRLRSAL